MPPKMSLPSYATWTPPGHLRCCAVTDSGANGRGMGYTGLGENDSHLRDEQRIHARFTPEDLEMARDARRSPYGTARTSPQREVIVRTVNAMRRAFTAEELVQALAETSSAPGIATVYRALAALEESGYVVRVGEREGAAMYARCDTDGHHHHLVCISCGRVSPASCPIDELVTAAAAEDGFIITSHEITLYGICSSCLSGDTSGGVH